MGDDRPPTDPAGTLMCDYCGCRRQPSIDALSEEHERLLDLVYFLRRDAARGDREAVTTALRTVVVPLLRHHTEKEERGLFTQLRAAWVADDRLDALEAEHRDIEELVAAVETAGQDWPAAVARLGDALSEHIFDEETDLFPYALYELDPRQWDAVDAAHESVPAPTGVVAAGRP